LGESFSVNTERVKRFSVHAETVERMKRMKRTIIEAISRVEKRSAPLFSADTQ